MTAATHDFPVRVYYEDTDAQKIVYYANYFRFMERARTEMMREAGFSHASITHEDRQFFVVGEASARYKASARLDDDLIIRSSVANLGNASLKLQQNVVKRLADEESLLVEGVITLIYVSEDGKPVRIPDKMREALQKYL
jgi:tol-pal system-associated acyl-CoA thioesterase